MSLSRELTWITPKWPLPADDGAKQATTQLLRELAGQGVAIHLCSLVPAGDAADPAQAMRELGLRSATVIRREKPSRASHLANLASRPWLPVTIAPFASAPVARAVRAEVEKREESLVVYDGLHAAGWALSERASARARRTVYRAHNVERDLWVRGAREKKNPALRAFLRYQARLVGGFEKDVAARAGAVFPVSAVDEGLFREMLADRPARRPITSLPIGLSLNGVAAIDAAPAAGRPLLFVGRLDWPPNRDGLRWFLEKVWPEARAGAGDLTLTIVGSGDGSWLEPYKALPGVKFLGRVESLAPHYAACVATLVPVFFGSGTRVKAIESALHGRACLSTALGVEGIGLTDGSDYYNAETAEEWIDALRALDGREALERGARARRLAAERFDPRRIAEKFIHTVREAGLA
jgi:glycosyltransferase involved in cell wall biosynthesis